MEKLNAVNSDTEVHIEAPIASDIQYLKDKVADIKFELFSIYDRPCNCVDDKIDSHKEVTIT